ncbi:MAG TPA: response regulator [Polyangia bacterium]|nr:response regulator [Polyangia bacterium]
MLASAPLQGLRLLVVEDDETIRESLSELLRDEGATLQTASNGREALETLHAPPAPDLILLDLMMPVMDGWEFRVAQRADQALAGIPLIAMSADRSAKASAIAADAYIGKPLDISDLVGRIRRIVDETQEKRRAAADSAAAFGLLAAEIAHEINNPLTYVLANLHVLAEKFPAGSGDPAAAELHDLVADAVEGAERIRRVVKAAQRDPATLRHDHH